MHFRLFAVLFSALFLFQPAGLQAAGLEWEVLEERNLGLEATDIAVSEDGAWVFLLTTGHVDVYAVKEGKVVARIPVEDPFDRIAYSSTDNALTLSSSTSGRLLRLELQKVFAFDFEGLPFSGPEDAAVTLAVFSDYQ